jgi:hypothetical protein
MDVAMPLAQDQRRSDVTPRSAGRSDVGTERVTAAAVVGVLHERWWSYPRGRTSRRRVRVVIEVLEPTRKQG